MSKAKTLVKVKNITKRFIPSDNGMLQPNETGYVYWFEYFNWKEKFKLIPERKSRVKDERTEQADA